MRRIVGIAGLLFLGALGALIAAAILALALSFEAEPRVAARAPSPEELDRLKRTLQRQDPRRLAPGETGTLSLTDRELAIALREALALVGSAEAVRIGLDPGRLGLEATVELPTGLPRRFLNVDAVMRQTDGLPRFERLRIGKVPVPARLADAAWRWGVAGWLGRKGGADAIEMVREVAFHEARLDLTYRWEPGAVDSVRAGIVGEAERRRLEAFSARLAAVTAGRASRGVQLIELVGPLFELARSRSRAGEPAKENRAAIVVLGAYVGGRRLEALVPEAAEWPRPRRLQVTLQGKPDLARHFMTSAMVAAVGGGALVDALGLYKEIDDSRGGSGFSFQDVAANRAGTRFGELAIGSRESAARLQRVLGEEPAESLLLPPVRDLPEALSESELRELVGEVGSPRYRKLTAEIDQRIGASRLYRDH